MVLACNGSEQVQLRWFWGGVIAAFGTAFSFGSWCAGVVSQAVLGEPHSAGCFLTRRSRQPKHFFVSFVFPARLCGMVRGVPLRGLGRGRKTLLSGNWLCYMPGLPIL